MTTQKRGPSQDRGVLMDRILTVARHSFATHGSAGTSMRAVAVEAGVDPRLVAYYFTNKQSLLEACLVPPVQYLAGVSASTHQPLRGRGKAMVANMLHSWEDPDTGPILRAIVLTAVHEPIGLDRLQAVYRNNILSAIADALDDDQRDLRANLVAVQIIGLCMTRYVYRLEPIASLPAAEVIDLVGPNVQRSLTGRLPSTANRPSASVTAVPATRSRPSRARATAPPKRASRR